MADEEKRLEDACDWIAKLDRNLNTEEESKLQTWLAKNPKNVKTLLETAKLWDKMDNLSRLSELFPQTPAVVATKKQHKWAAAIAASILLALTIGYYQMGLDGIIFSQTEQSVIAKQMNYQTGIGENKTIDLPDKSRIILNTNSFVQIKYTASARIIELHRGEIHVDVAHDKSRPLSVITNGKVIQAVGTAFNVEIRNKLVELIVTEGKVLVAENEINIVTDNVNIEEMAKRLPLNTMAISKGEKINLDLTGHVSEKATKVDALDVAASLSWRQGNLIFRGESLIEAMAEISRYTNIEFEISDDKELKDIHVAGMFKTGDINGLLDVLSRNFRIKHEKINHNKVILTYAG
jgi:transmembrane sensor